MCKENIIHILCPLNEILSHLVFGLPVFYSANLCMAQIFILWNNKLFNHKRRRNFIFGMLTFFMLYVCISLAAAEAPLTDIKLSYVDLDLYCVNTLGSYFCSISVSQTHLVTIIGCPYKYESTACGRPCTELNKKKMWRVVDPVSPGITLVYWRVVDPVSPGITLVYWRVVDPVSPGITLVYWRVVDPVSPGITLVYWRVVDPVSPGITLVQMAACYSALNIVPRTQGRNGHCHRSNYSETFLVSLLHTIIEFHMQGSIDISKSKTVNHAEGWSCIYITHWFATRVPPSTQ